MVANAASAVVPGKRVEIRSNASCDSIPGMDALVLTGPSEEAAANTAPARVNNHSTTMNHRRRKENRPKRLSRLAISRYPISLDPLLAAFRSGPVPVVVQMQASNTKIAVCEAGTGRRSSRYNPDMGKHHLWVLSAATLVLAGCSSGSSTSTTSVPAGSSAAATTNSAATTDAAAVEAYRKELDAKCAASAAFNRSLPALRASQNLSMDEMLARIKQDGDRLRSGIARATPPAALAGTHQKLVADGDKLRATGSRPVNAETLTVQTEIARALVNDFEIVGAKGCAHNERQAVKFFQTQRRNLGTAATPG
jgi:hypothetical protein